MFHGCAVPAAEIVARWKAAHRQPQLLLDGFQTRL
jgi:hypothetical protein